MREILYRGLHRRKGEKVRLDGTPVESKWVYGGVCQYNEERAIIYQTEPEIAKFPVYAETVGQYTGLTDKNGRKIFEGDIVKYIYEPGEGFWNANQKSVIVWDSTGFKLDGIMGTNKYALMQGWLVSVPCTSSLFEVIGNIHDNPELLEGGIL